MNKKRKKFTRHRGSHTHSRGAKKKARGKGHRGGIGMSGSGKRGDQKKSKVLNLFGKKYFGKDKTLRKKSAIKLKVINLRDISNNLDSLKGNSNKIVLKGYKILSLGNISQKLTINASAASKSAIDKIKKAGGNIILR